MTEGKPAATQSGPLGRYNLMTSLALITPLFLVYQVGVLLTWPLHNGADLVTTFLIDRLNFIGYIVLNTAVAASFVIMAASRRGKEGVQAKQFIPLLIESAIYAFFLGSAIIFVMMKLLRLSPPQMALQDASTVDLFVMSAGAGVHEELLFRLLILNGLVLLCKAMKFGPIESFIAALVFSSTLFSAVHHLGSLGDPFTPWVFIFRLLAGLAFGVIYWLRGFAVAVYTHALYDMYVLLVR